MGAVCASVVVAHHTARVVLVDFRPIAAGAADVEARGVVADHRSRIHDFCHRRVEAGNRRVFNRFEAAGEHGGFGGGVRGELFDSCRLHCERGVGAAACSCAVVLAIEAGRVVVDEHRTKSALAADPVSSVRHGTVVA